MKAAEFDRKFEEGKDIIDDLDLTSIVKINNTKLELDLPKDYYQKIIKISDKLGKSKEELIFNWIDEKVNS